MNSPEQPSSSTVEFVEIRDNGVQVDLVEVTDGKWSHSVTGLTPGPHQFTAHHRSKMSTPWSLTAQRVDIEDFQDAPLGDITTLHRPFYTGQRLAPPIYERTTLIEIRGALKRIFSIRANNTNGMFADASYLMTFAETYSQIIISTTRALAARLQTLRADGSQAALINAEKGTITLGTPNNPEIKFLKIYTTGNIKYADIEIDEMHFIK